jgi:hypothetical protein
VVERWSKTSDTGGRSRCARNCDAPLNAAASLTDLHQRNGDTSAVIAVLDQAITWDPTPRSCTDDTQRLFTQLVVPTVRRIR